MEQKSLRVNVGENKSAVNTGLNKGLFALLAKVSTCKTVIFGFVAQLLCGKIDF